MTEKAFMSDETHATLDQAIAAARAGRRDDAIRMLRQIVADNPFNADAWVWLGGIATDPREQRAALEQALAITPDNQRAQQGLSWLRQTHPAIFEQAAATRTLEQRATPSYEQQATYQTQADATPQSRAAVYDMPAQSTPYNAPTQAVPVQQAYDAPTQAMPTYRAQSDAALVQPTHQTDRMSTFTPLNSTVVDAGSTNRMAAVPAPAAPATVMYRRTPGASLARWLVLLTWIFSFGAVATSAAVLWAFPNLFQGAVQPFLALFRLQLVPADVPTTTFITTVALTALAVFDLMMILGLIFRSRVAWGINAVIATMIMLGAAALVGLAAAGLTPFSTGGFSFSTQAEQILGGLLAFTVVFFVLSLASRRAFFRRQVEQYT
jgi:hypothetical protein